MPYLLGFFTAGGVVFKFFEWIGKSIFTKGLILPVQFVVLGLVVIIRVSIITALFALSLEIFNLLHTAFDMFNTLDKSYPLVFEIPFKFLSNLGFFEAIQSHLPLFSLLILTYFTVVLSKLLLNTMELIARELFQIGLLTSG